LGLDGFTEKTRELDDAKTGEVIYWREQWATLTNERLKARGVESRIDHRTLEAQGIDRVPTAHKGPLLTALERRGIEARVSRRLNQERAEDIQSRLTHAAELGRLDREAQELKQSMLVLSTDIAAARAARARTGPRMGAVSHADDAQKAVERWKEQYGQRLSPSMEDVQRQAREAWLKLRQNSNEAPEQRHEAKRVLDLDAARGKDREQDKDLDLDR
jgi:hypothetical protein